MKEGIWGKERFSFFPFRRSTSQRTLTSKTGEGRDFLFQGPISGALNQNALYSSPSDDLGGSGSQAVKPPRPKLSCQQTQAGTAKTELNQNALYSSPSDDELSPASLRFLGVYHSNKQRCD